jgi:hypothetical protein
VPNAIPEKISNFRVYLDGKDLLGVADVELPDLEYMTETVAGAGIAGEMDSPVVGHFKSMSLKLKWRSVTADLTALAAPKAHHLDLRGSIQVYDAGAGAFVHTPLKVVVKAIPKKAGLGKLEMGKPQDSESEFEVAYLKLTHDGTDRVEIDKLNFICVIDGTDYLGSIRTNLGI